MQDISRQQQKGNKILKADLEQAEWKLSSGHLGSQK